MMSDLCVFNTQGDIEFFSVHKEGKRDVHHFTYYPNKLSKLICSLFDKHDSKFPDSFFFFVASLPVNTDKGMQPWIWVSTSTFLNWGFGSNISSHISYQVSSKSTVPTHPEACHGPTALIVFFLPFTSQDYLSYYLE